MGGGKTLEGDPFFGKKGSPSKPPSTKNLKQRHHPSLMVSLFELFFEEGVEFKD